MNRVICLIQARMASSRLPGKSLAMLAGRPVLEHVVRRLAACPRVDGLVVATSVEATSDPIAEWVARNPGAAGGKPLGLARGDERDCLTRFLAAAAAHPAKIYMRATGDNPLVDPEMAARLVECLEETNCDYTGCDGALPKGLATECFWRRTLERCGELETEKFERECITYPMYSRPGVFTVRRVPTPDELNRPDYRLTLDTDEDCALFTRLFERFGSYSEKIKTVDVIRFLDENPEVAATNAHVVQRPAQEIDW